MGADTKIEWTDASWNPVRAKRYDGFDDANDDAFRHGWFCEHVSEGCRNCYAERVNRRLGTDFDFKPGYRGRMKHFLQENLLLAPLKWREPRRVFLSSMTDIFGDWVSDDMLDRMFAIMALTPQHTYQVLTKRPERARAYVRAVDSGARWLRFKNVIGDAHWPLPNVWMGTSVEDQAAAGERILRLLTTPAQKHFLSCEPLLAPLDLRRWLPGIDWVIAGGESGPNARPMHPDWARSLRDQCAAAGVPFFFKQWGEWLPGQNDWDRKIAIHQDGSFGASVTTNSSRNYVTWDEYGIFRRGWINEHPEPFRVFHWATRVGKRRAGRLLDGVEHSGVPA